MEYVNHYLDKMALLFRGELKGGLSDKSVRELVDEALIEIGFIKDVKEIVRRYESGEFNEEDAKRNLDLLRVYVVTQLKDHRRKVIEMLNLPANIDLDGNMVKRVVDFIESALDRI
jgi:hypothetical protein